MRKAENFPFTRKEVVKATRIYSLTLIPPHSSPSPFPVLRHEWYDSQTVMNDHQIAASLFNPASIAGGSSSSSKSIPGERDGASAGQKAHSTRSHLLDASGARLTGKQRELAELMHSQQNFQFMEMNMAGKGGSRKRERDRSPDTASGAQVKSQSQIMSEMEQERQYLFSVVQGVPDGPEGASKRRNRQVHFSMNEVRTTLPDMFGNVAASKAGSANKTAGGGEDGDLWNVDGELAVDVADGAEGQTGISGITWELVPTTRVTTRLCEKSGQRTRAPCLEQVGVGWRRRDSLDLGRAMDRAASRVVATATALDPNSCSISSSSGRTARNVWMQALLMSWDENDVFDPVYADTETPNTSVYWGDGLTFTHDEYLELQLDSDAFQPLPITLTSQQSPARQSFRFDEQSTRKLLELYNRFGNFVVVADRWKFASCTGREPSQSPQIPPLAEPSVEDCCARYTKVSEALIEHRIEVLRSTLTAAASTNPNPLLREEEPKSKVTTGAGAKGEARTQSSSRAAANSKDSVENTVWMKMANSHPTHRQKELREKEQRIRGDSFSKALTNALERLEALRNSSPSSVATVDPDVSGSVVPKQLLQAAPWYDEAVERLRRHVITLHLDREKRTNVPFERAAEHLATIMTELQNLELRVDSYFANPDAEDAPKGNEMSKAARTNRSGGSNSNSKTRGAGGSAATQDYSVTGGGSSGGVDDSYLATMREAAAVEYFSERIRLATQAGFLFFGNASSSSSVTRGAAAGSIGSIHHSHTNAASGGATAGQLHGDSDVRMNALERALLGNSQWVAAALPTKEASKLWANFVQVVKAELAHKSAEESSSSSSISNDDQFAECKAWIQKLLAPSPLSRVFSVRCGPSLGVESKMKSQDEKQRDLEGEGMDPNVPSSDSARAPEWHSNSSGPCAVYSAMYNFPADVNHEEEKEEHEAFQSLQEELLDMVLRALRGTVSTAREDLTTSVNATVGMQSSKSNAGNSYTTPKGTTKNPLGGALNRTDEHVNYAVSNVSECVLLTLPNSTPQLYRKVEEEMEKHLLEHHRALSDDNALTLYLVNQSRTLYMQNLILRRFMNRVQNTEASLKKLKSETTV